MATIKDCLASPDIEMVQLGALLITQTFPKRDWEPLLREYNIYPTDEYLIKGAFSYNIVDNNIYILEVVKERITRLHTGKGGMTLFNNALLKWKIK